MAKTTMGLAALACIYESGGERAENLLQQAVQKLEEDGITVEIAKKVVWTQADALEVCKQFAKAGVSSVTLIETTWVMDSVKYLFIQKLKVPFAFWAVPYSETFSMGSVQHFGSILTNQGIHFEYVYGLPEKKELIDKLKKIAIAGEMIREVKNMNIALLGPRQTWRVAGAQDTTNEEWEYSQKIGPAILHIEMEEVFDRIDKISDEDAQKALEELLPRTGKSLLDEISMKKNAKVYLAVKDIMKANHVQAVAAECYPQFGGLMELSASWLADERIQLDTEGDISHSVLMHLLYQFTKGRTALCEAGSIDQSRNIILASHAGSSAQSIAGNLSKVQISPCGDGGAFVGTPVKAMEKVTVLSFVGKAGKYKMMIANGRTLDVPTEKWVENGEKMLAYLQFDENVDDTVRNMVEHGMDHHLLIHEGDCAEIMELFCDYMGIEKVLLG